jgi:toxin ParE1/3/4
MEHKEPVYTISKQALQEIEEAAQWYEMEVAGLGLQFVTAFETSITTILKNPTAYTAIASKSSIRRFLIKRFSYKIFFVIVPTGIHVLAVIHAHRSKRFMRRRLR